MNMAAQAFQIDASALVPLSRGLFALVSPDDLDRVSAFRWRASSPDRNGRSYAQRTHHTGPRSQRKTSVVLMHRLILEAPTGVLVDHINGDRLDNRRENLRLTDHRGNARNRGLHRNNTSGFKGVIFYGGRWYAQIKVDRRNRGLGGYSAPEDAARAYDRAALHHYGEFASLNFPEAASC